MNQLKLPSLPENTAKEYIATYGNSIIKVYSDNQADADKKIAQKIKKLNALNVVDVEEADEEIPQTETKETPEEIKQEDTNSNINE